MSELKLNTPFTVDEIDFRVQSVNNGGYAVILAYKDARADMNRLDAVYGVDVWQKKYDVINNNLFCSLLANKTRQKSSVSPALIFVGLFRPRRSPTPPTILSSKPLTDHSQLP